MNLFRKKVPERKGITKLHFVKMRTEARYIDHIQAMTVGVYNSNIIQGAFDLDLLINDIVKDSGIGNQHYQFARLSDNKIPVSINGDYFGLATSIGKFDCNIAGAANIEYYVITIVYDDIVQNIKDGNLVARFTDFVNTGRYILYIERYEDRLYFDFQVEGLDNGTTSDDKAHIPDN